MKANAPAQAEIGALVQYCGHSGCFMADIIRVGDATVVNAGRPISPDSLIRDGSLGQPTHQVVDFPIAGFWQPRKGVFVVPSAQVTRLESRRG